MTCCLECRSDSGGCRPIVDLWPSATVGSVTFGTPEVGGALFDGSDCVRRVLCDAWGLGFEMRDVHTLGAHRALCEKAAVFAPPVATGPRALNSAPPVLV